MIKLPTLLFTAVLATVSSASALTDAEITPAALKGKTLTVTIGYGARPFATTGTWSGAISSAGTTFTMTKITGDTVNSTSSCTFKVENGYTVLTMDELVSGFPTAQMALYVDKNGVGGYEMYIPNEPGGDHANNLPAGSQSGTFTIGATVNGPVVSLQQGDADLADGKGKTDFGSVAPGKSKSKVFTIKNAGTTKLKNLAVTLDGRNKSEYSVSAPAVKSLAPGKSTTFKVTFKPKTGGKKKAAFHVTSNDKKSGPFDVKLVGQGEAK